MDAYGRVGLVILVVVALVAFQVWLRAGDCSAIDWTGVRILGWLGAALVIVAVMTGKW